MVKPTEQYRKTWGFVPTECTLNNLLLRRHCFLLLRRRFRRRRHLFLLRRRHASSNFRNDTASSKIDAFLSLLLTLWAVLVAPLPEGLAEDAAAYISAARSIQTLVQTACFSRDKPRLGFSMPKYAWGYPRDGATSGYR